MLRFQKFWVFWKVQNKPHPTHLLPTVIDKKNCLIFPTTCTNIGGYKLASDHYRAMASMCTHNENESIHHREKLDISTKNPSPKKNWNRTSIFLCRSMPVLVAWVGTCRVRTESGRLKMASEPETYEVGSRVSQINSVEGDYWSQKDQRKAFLLREMGVCTL